MFILNRCDSTLCRPAMTEVPPGAPRPNLSALFGPLVTRMPFLSSLKQRLHKIEWITPHDFQRRIRGWAVVFFDRKHRQLPLVSFAPVPRDLLTKI